MTKKMKLESHQTQQLFPKDESLHVSASKGMCVIKACDVDMCVLIRVCDVDVCVCVSKGT